MNAMTLMIILAVYLVGAIVCYFVTRKTFRTEFEHVWFSVVWFVTLFWKAVDAMRKGW